MRYTLNLSFLEPQNYLSAAQAAETAGFTSIGLSDSVFFPRETSSRYPYNDDGSRGHFENVSFLDAFALVPAMGAVTERIRFVTAVVKLPLRHPVIAAKLAASVAVLTGDRLSLGVGLSPWPEDYEVCGIPWEGRGTRLDECVAIIRGLTRGGYLEWHGEHYRFPEVKMLPVPDRPIPIIVGGHSAGALRRAARTGDGWIAPATGIDVPRLAEMVATLRRERAASDWRDDPFEIHASYDARLDAEPRQVIADIDALAEIGITDVRVAFRRPPDPDGAAGQLRHLRADIERFSVDVLHAAKET